MFNSIYNFEQAKKQYYIDLVNGYGPYRIFNTLTFQSLINDEQGRAIADIYWRRLNKKVFDMYRCPANTCLHGVVVLERKSIRKDRKGRKNPHFHFLIKDHPILSDDIDKAVDEIQLAGVKASRNFKTFSGRRLVSKKMGVHTCEAYDDGVVGYLSKEATQWGWKAVDRVFLLDKKGLVSFDATPSHKMF